MKRIAFTLFLICAAFTSVHLHAQEYMVIEKSDGTSLRLDVKDINQVSFQIEETLTVTGSPVNIGSTANSQGTFSISSNTNWTITGNPSWLSLSSASGSGNATITVKALSANTSVTNTRETTLTIKAGQKTATVKVVQAKDSEILTVTGSPVNIGSAANSQGSFNISSNANWTITGNPSWLSLSSASGNGNAAVTVKALSANTSVTNTREATLTIKAGEKTATVKVVQAKDSEILTVTGSPVNISSAANSQGSFGITSNANWIITGVPSWLSLSSVSGSGNATITVKALSANTSETNTREVTLTVKGSEITAAVKVVQTKKESSVIYREPYTVWGATMSQTKSYMSSYVLYREESTTLAYIGKDKEALIMYNFVDSKLSGSAVAVTTSAATRTEIGAQLQSRGYQYVGEKDGTYIYLSTDQKTIATISENSSLGAYYIYYLPYESSPTKLFEEPYVNWGATRSTVKSAVSNRGYTLIDESTSSSDNYYLAYNGKYKETFTMYQFDSSMKLSQAIIACSPSSVSLADARSYVASSSGLSYTYVTTSSDGNQYFYLSSDGNTIAIVYTLTSGTTKLTTISFISYSSVMSSTRHLSRGAAPENFTPMEIPESVLGDLLLKRLSMMVKQHISTQPSFPVIIK